MPRTLKFSYCMRKQSPDSFQLAGACSLVTPHVAFMLNFHRSEKEVQKIVLFLMLESSPYRHLLKH